MRHLVRPIALLGFATLLLAGCGRVQHQEREPWRAQAELACLRSNKINPSDYIRKIPAIGNSWSCGADYPLKVSAFAEETTASIPGQQGQQMMTSITPEATLVCPMVVAMDQWVAEVIQPAAMQRFGQPVVQIKTMGSYNCRPRNNQSGAKLSEHGFANAVDIAGFLLADGTTVTVVRDWTKGTPEQQAFLREVHRGACRMFTTVLGPGANIFHYNHIHVDLARHGVKGDRHYCKPEIGDIPVTPLPTDMMDRNIESRTSMLRPGQQPNATAYLGRPGANTAAPVYNQSGQLQPQTQFRGGAGQLPPSGPTSGYNPNYRPPQVANKPMAVGVQPPSPPDDTFEGNDDENVNVHDLDMPDEGPASTGTTYKR